MSFSFKTDELISISELRKDVARIKRFMKSGKRKRYLLTDNGKIFAVMVDVKEYEKNPLLSEIHVKVPKIQHTDEDLKKVLFSGPKDLSERINDIYS